MGTGGRMGGRGGGMGTGGRMGGRGGGVGMNRATVSSSAAAASC